MQRPVMDGVTAARLIREVHLTQHLPIVAMTVNAMKQDRDRCMEAGMNGFVTKPIDPTALWHTLLDWVRRHEGLGASTPQPGADIAAHLPSAAWAREPGPAGPCPRAGPGRGPGPHPVEPGAVWVPASQAGGRSGRRGTAHPRGTGGAGQCRCRTHGPYPQGGRRRSRAGRVAAARGLSGSRTARAGVRANRAGRTVPVGGSFAARCHRFERRLGRHSQPVTRRAAGGPDAHRQATQTGARGAGRHPPIVGPERPRRHRAVRAACRAAAGYASPCGKGRGLDCQL